MKVELDYRIPELPRPLEGNYQLDQDILKHLFDTAKIDRKFNHYLKDKSVIIVGPASYLKGTKRGEFIDSFDIVVRCNGFWKPPIEHQEDIGKKTTIRWHSGAEFPNTGGMWDIPDMLNYGVEYVCIQYPTYLDYFHDDVQKFKRKNEPYNIPFHNWSDLELYLSIHHYLGTRLQCGMSAVADLLFYDVKKLHVSGFSFHSEIKQGVKGGGDYLNGAKPSDYIQSDYDKEKHTFVNHAQLPQMRFLRELETFDNRLSFDKETDEVLKRFNI